MKSSCLVFLLAFGLILNGCDSATTEAGTGEGGTAEANTAWSECSQNETQDCKCMVDGNLTEGLQSCNTDGSGWNVCDCGQSTGTEDEGSGTTDETIVFDCVPETLHDTQKCSDGDVFWFDDCDEKNDLIMECDGINETCEDNMCVVDNSPDDPDDGECLTHSYKGCEGSNAYWFDSCDVKEDFVETCGENTLCSQGECIMACEPHAKKLCKSANIYWYDSCDNEESLAESCEEEEFCKGCTVDDDPCTLTGDPYCIKPVYNGDWLLSADPDSKNACGLGTTQYPDQVLELTVDGTTATGVINVLGYTVTYEGSVDGKKLTMTASYTQTGATGNIEHDELMDFTFESLTMLSGTHQDSWTTGGTSLGMSCTTDGDCMGLGTCSNGTCMMAGMGCDTFWNVTGVKQ